MERDTGSRYVKSLLSRDNASWRETGLDLPTLTWLLPSDHVFPDSFLADTDNFTIAFVLCGEAKL